MQKRVLACLLASPLALNALADIVVNDNLANNGEGWIQDGITGHDPIFTENGVNCSFVGGWIATTLENLNPGDYKITFATSENINVEVMLGGSNGQVISEVAENGDVTFNLKTTSSVYIKISPKNTAEFFKFSGAKVEIVIDFKAIQATLRENLSALELTEVDADDIREAAATLRTQLASLTEAVQGVKDDITALNNETIENYNEFELWTNPNTIQKAIDALTPEVKAYNEAVKAENDTWAVVKANKAAYDALTTAMGNLDDLFDAQEVKYNEALAKVTEGSSWYKDYQTNMAASTEAYNTAKNSLADFKAAVADAYAEPEKWMNWVDPIEFTDTQAEVKADIEAIQTALDAAAADWTAYQALMNLQAELKTKADKATADLAKLAEGEGNVYGDYIAGLQAKVKEIYNQAMEDVTVKNGEPVDAADSQEADTAILNKALADIAKVVADAQAKVNGLDAAYEAAMTEVETLQAELDKIRGLIALPDSQIEEFQALVKTAQDAINALKNAIQNGYAALELPDTTELKAAARTAIDNVINFNEAWAPVAALWSDFAQLQGYVKGLQEKSGVPTTDFDLASKYASTFNNIKKAIDDLSALLSDEDPDTNPIDGDVANVKQAIKDARKSATQLMNAYQNVYDSVKAFSDGVGALNAAIDGKLILLESFNPVAFRNSDEYKALVAALENFKTKKAAAAAAESQDAYDLATALNTEIGKYGYQAQLRVVEESFEVASTETGNYNAVKKAIDDVKAYAAEGTYEGQADVDFTEIDKDLAKAMADITTQKDAYAAGNDVDYAEWSKIDTFLKDLLDKVNAKDAQIKALKDNQAAYDDLMDLFAPALGDALDALVQYNNENSLTPAKEYYDNLIQGADNETSLKAQMDALEEEINKALTDFKAVELTTSLKNKIDGLKQAIEKMQNDIKANNTNHDNQLLKSDAVRTHIMELLAGMADADQALTQDWRDALNKLMDEDLANVDLEVNQVYGNGKSAAENDKLIQKYEDILAQADQIYAQYQDKYGDRVSTTNANTVTDAKWTASQTDMNNAYTDAIKAYNSFFSLDNAKYREYILEIVKTHQPIYEYSAQITALIAEVQAWIDKKNSDKVVFTAAEFAEVATAKAQAMVEEINAKKADMMTDANEGAQNYYIGTADMEGIHPAAVNAVADAQTTLEGAGVSADNVTAALKAAKAFLAAGEKLYNGTPAEGDNAAVPGFPAESEWATSNFCLAPMNSIANYFDEVYKNIDLQKAAQNQWSENYTAASKTLGDLTAQLDKIVDKDDESRAKLAEYVDAAAELNGTATADKKLIEHLKADTDELNKILAAAQALVDEKQQAYDNDQANQAQLEKYKADLAKINLDLDALKAFAATVAGGANWAFAPVEDLIAAFETLYTETYQASLLDHKSEIDAAYTNALNKLNAQYGLIKDNEQNVLGVLLQKTEVAFNNAKVLSKTMTAEQLAEANAAIDAFGDEIMDINALSVPAKKDNYSERAVSVEKGLSALYVKLMSSYETTGGVEGGNPVPGILAELNGQYSEVSAAIAAAQEYLDSCEESVQTDKEFAGKFAEFKAELDAIKGAYEADGDRVVVTQDGHEAGMSAIDAAVEALLTKVEAAQKIAADEKARIEANNKAYADLSAELAAYQKELDVLVEDAGNHLVKGLVEGWIDVCQEAIDDQQKDLDEWHKAVELNAESTLEDKATIEYNLYLIRYYSELYYAQNLVDAIDVAYTDANTALGGNLVPGTKAELAAELNKLSRACADNINEANKVLKDYREGEIDATTFTDQMHDCSAKFVSIKEAIEALINTIEENTFKLGDIDLDPNGEVNVVDLQILINMVLEGVTFDELEEESPRVAYAADITGSKVIDIADVTALINMINDADNADETAAPRLAPRASRMSGNGVYGMDMVSSENTAREYAMALSGMTSFAGAQMDIQLPAGMTLESVELADASTDHEIAIYDNGAGNYRLVIYSMTNSTVNAVEGVMLRIHTSGIGTPEMSNVIFADGDSNSWDINKANQSIIDSIISGAKNLKDRIYNVAGQTMRKIQKGINIIRHSDGTTTKEMH